MGRKLVLALSFGLLAVVLIGAVSPSGQESSPGQADDPSLVGHELAASLGLERITPFPVTGCRYFTEAEDKVGYCLDPVVTNERNAWLLSTAIMGRVPIAADEEMYELLHERSQLAATGEDEARLGVVISRMIELMEQRELELATP